MLLYWVTIPNKLKNVVSAYWSILNINEVYRNTEQNPFHSIQLTSADEGNHLTTFRFSIDFLSSICRSSYFQGMYFVSSVLLMRMNMPHQYRFVIITELVICASFCVVKENFITAKVRNRISPWFNLLLIKVKDVDEEDISKSDQQRK